MAKRESEEANRTKNPEPDVSLATINYEYFQALAKLYLDLQQVRMGFFHREGKLPSGADVEIANTLHQLGLQVHNLERQTLAKAKELFKNHPIWDWCSYIRGFSDVACLTFLGYINPFYVHPEKRGLTAGMLKRKFGLTPGQKMQRGRKLDFDPHAKGRFLGVLTKNVIMKRDSYYYALYDAKKEYYANETRDVFLNGTWVKWPGFNQILKDRTICPDYKNCLERLRKRARREGRAPKTPPCQGHMDLLARRWLGGLLVSHALQILREAEGLDVSNLLSHRTYIRPKASKDDVPEPEILDAIRKGKLLTRPPGVA